MSDRLRLDLVVNDFVACAVSSGNITILSDGTPWRPLIHVKDMPARSIGLSAGTWLTVTFLAVNVGSNTWKLPGQGIGGGGRKVVPGVEHIDKQECAAGQPLVSVDFSLYERLRPSTSRRSICSRPSLNSRRALKRWASATGISAAPSTCGSRYSGLRQKGMLDGNLGWTGA